jgi:hypothetical protein
VPRTPNQLLYEIKYRAKATGLDFNLDLSDIPIPDICPVLGIALHMGKGKHHSGSPTVDRIDPQQGYVKGNVWVISHRANQIKSDATLQELQRITAALTNRLTRSALSASDRLPLLPICSMGSA